MTKLSCRWYLAGATTSSELLYTQYIPNSAINALVILIYIGFLQIHYYLIVL